MKLFAQFLGITMKYFQAEEEGQTKVLSSLRLVLLVKCQLFVCVRFKLKDCPPQECVMWKYYSMIESIDRDAAKDVRWTLVLWTLLDGIFFFLFDFVFLGANSTFQFPINIGYSVNCLNPGISLALNVLCPSKSVPIYISRDSILLLLYCLLPVRLR